ncbi:MAG: hypothetical protein J6Y84_01210 [Bacteroidaceae bacterium]|nr:hypothetical protein [Bacteroidaceae bacterium]
MLYQLSYCRNTHATIQISLAFFDESGCKGNAILETRKHFGQIFSKKMHNRCLPLLFDCRNAALDEFFPAADNRLETRFWVAGIMLNTSRAFPSSSRDICSPKNFSLLHISSPSIPF